MTTTRSAPRPGRAGIEQLPRPVLIGLSCATMVMVMGTGEMLPTAVLPQMSSGLGVTEARTGLLVSLWAAVVVVASFPLVRVTRRWDRRAVITGSLAMFGIAAAVTGLAPTYAVALAARSVGAAAVGLLWSTVNAYVADLVPDRLLGRATALVLAGATFGMVLGTPAGRFVADIAGWRTSFVVLAVASAVTAWTVWRVAPSRAGDVGSGVSLSRPPRKQAPLRPMVTVTALVALVLVGHYGAYTYITRLTEVPASRLPGGMSALLLGFGVASAAGVALAARVGNRLSAALVASTAATSVTVLGLAAADGSAVLGILLVVAWGVASGALPPLAQTLILRLAGPQRRWLAGALIPVMFNGGIAVGAALASAVVVRSGTDAVPSRAAAVVATAAVGLLLSLGALRRGVAGAGRAERAEAVRTAPQRRSRGTRA
jgi:predicted MFS family arabinose efflux permease